MVKLHPARIRARAQQEGAAIFVIVLTVTLLTAIGVFAARSAGMVTQASGYARQAHQTLAVADLGTQVAAASFGSGAAQAYVEQMTSSAEECFVTKDQPEPYPGVKPPCYKLYDRELANRVLGGELLDTGSAGLGTGSLSAYQAGVDTSGVLEAGFRIEISDPGNVGAPVAGADEGRTGGTPFTYIQVGMTAIAQVRPPPVTAGTCDDASAAAAGTQTTRAQVIVGPLPH